MFKVGDEVLIRAKVLEVNPANLTYDCEIGIGGRRYGYEIPAECIVFTDKTYSDGLTDAWELAKKVLLSKDKGGLTTNELADIFYTTYPTDVFEKYSYEEALAKIEAYEKEKEIKVGDVVKYGVYTCVVTVAYTETAEVLFGDGTFGTIVKEKAENTGKHIDIESLLRQIGE